MAENEQAHRHAIERIETGEPFRLARRGQMLALSVVVLILVFASFLAIIGHPYLAATVVGIDLLGLVIVFITGQSTRPAEPSEPAVEPEAEQPPQGT